MTNITLFCLMQSDDPSNIFEVEIENDKYISDLKEEIEKKKPGADIYKLRRVDIPLENNDKVFKSQPCSSVKEFDGKELDTTKITFLTSPLLKRKFILSFNARNKCGYFWTHWTWQILHCQHADSR